MVPARLGPILGERMSISFDGRSAAPLRPGRRPGRQDGRDRRGHPCGCAPPMRSSRRAASRLEQQVEQQVGKKERPERPIPIISSNPSTVAPAKTTACRRHRPARRPRRSGGQPLAAWRTGPGRPDQQATRSGRPGRAGHGGELGRGRGGLRLVARQHGQSAPRPARSRVIAPRRRCGTGDDNALSRVRRSEPSIDPAYPGRREP